MIAEIRCKGSFESDTMFMGRKSKGFFLILLFASFATNSTFQKCSKNCHSSRCENLKSLGRRERKQLLKKDEYEGRRQIWEERYGSFKALQITFRAGPRNLSPEETRRLYHSLLPRSLLGLYEMGLMNPEELAPLAYKARIAAKEYARSRCVWTARLATTVFDQYRNLRDKKRFGSSSMSWEEIYQKYEAQIVREECTKALEQGSQKKIRRDENFTMRIYVRILERSCTTNQAFDSLFLRNKEGDSSYLADISSQLENDVRSILLGPKDDAKALRKQRRILRRQLRIGRREKKKHRKVKKKKWRKKREELKFELHEKVEAMNRVTAETSSVNYWKVISLLASAHRDFKGK